MASRDEDDILRRNKALADRLNITATPSFVVGDLLIPRAVKLADLKALVQELRGREQSLKVLLIVGRGDDQHVPDPRQHQRGQRVVDHRLVVDRHQLLADAERHRVQTATTSAGEDDPSHRPNLSRP